MADLGALVTIADKVFQLLQSPVLRDMNKWESDLENLNNSVTFIKNMLLDADRKPELSHGEQSWVSGLNEILYDADDLFDEVITIAKQKEFNAGAKFSKKVLDKVSRFFSSKNRILVSYNTSHEVKSIQQKLDAIARDHSRYEFKVEPQAALKRKQETCSFLDETHENIIGREDDVKAVVDILLDPNVEENVGFVAVVGVGGLGKTTLARLVYNHDRLRTMFEKRLWACVSDQDGKELDVQAILGNIIESSTNKKPSDLSTMQSMQTKLQEELKNKTYLLILDDVWTEDPNEWSKLRRYLTIGGRGSRVVITTRSEKTAEVILGKVAHSKKYILKGLSDENSWRLFVLTAFERESDDPELTKIGKKIVKKCSNVPLAIKVLGTLLYGQTDRWKSFVENRLPQIEITKNPIMSILKISYNNLEPSLKCCFRYCALFPKDFEMNKRKLISLWMAQGYTGDSEDYFLILLKRCFFQDVRKDDLGDVVSFKMHDLMHDLAQEVAGEEIIVVNSPPNNLSKKNRHLFLDGGEWTRNSFHERNIRTCYMNTRVHSDVVKTLVANWCCLRSLRLYVPDAENLSESIGELLHLRYLDLSKNVKLKTLPNSITKLYNLHSLILHSCYSLKEWPKYFCKLVNLRLLDINFCSGLTCLPLGIDQLINLHDLTDFNVGGVSSIGKQCGQLIDLKFLVNLRGRINIVINENLVSDQKNVWEGSYLEHIQNLKVVRLSFTFKARETNNEALIAKLQPNRNLMELWLSGYNGTEIPRWGRAEDDWAIILPNLVKIELRRCERLHGIPLLSKLKYLKFLILYELNNLEYMEIAAITHGSSVSTDSPFFPSLECLRIERFESLKGWWGGVGEGDSSSGMQYWQPPFPRLSTLSIISCPKLMSLPSCPRLESLEVTRSNKSFRILVGEGPANLGLNLRVEEIDTVDYLTTLPACRLTHIKIDDHQESKSLSEIEEVFVGSSSLQSLEINGCKRRTSVLGALKHLTALKSLSLKYIPALEDDVDDMPWSSLRHNLRSLELDSLDTMQILPTGMRHLTALEKLSIRYCNSLNCLPEWISCLSSLQSLTIESCGVLKSLGTIQNITSLQKLEILDCPYLTEACQKPSGKEWPKIQHIPHISITDFHW
ncbi:putative disease resistance protein RGA1 [Silene latifolia]|uniref:putative disease resistance protein RGA1 n=1 Tax=Silene latifolia TaxID=37657 RepID=UPI003D7809E0